MSFLPKHRRNTLLTPLLIVATLITGLASFSVRAEDPTTLNLSQDRQSGGVLSSLSRKLGISTSDDPFLTPDQAFIFSIEAKDSHTLHASWEIQEGYHLYRNKFTVALKDSPGTELETLTIPRGKEIDDENFGRMEVFYDHVEILQTLRRVDTSAHDITVVVGYQGCADAGFCYPPIKQEVVLSLPAAASVEPPAPATAEPASTPNPATGFESEQDQLARALSEQSKLWTLLTFYGLGLLLAFTPCVFPMVPILSSIIVGQGPQVSTTKAFSLSLAYVLAMALTNTTAGVLVVAAGINLTIVTQTPWVLITFATVFAILALSMFGFYELQLPSSWQAKLTELSNRQQSGTLIGAAIMGLLSALIVSPCVAAPLAGALLYISQTGDTLLGGSALFALSMGMGTPLLLIGSSAGKLLPKAGGWMDTIKAVFGVMLLGLAVWMLDRILPPNITMALWALLAIPSAIYMGALDHLQPEASGWKKLWKGLGVVLLIYGAVLLIGAASGSTSMVQPLGNFQVAQASGTNPIQARHLPFQRVKGYDGLQQALETARGRPVMLDFYADWCVSCKEMENFTFSDPSVQAALHDVVLLQADVTANDAGDQALLKQLGLIGPPSILFFDEEGKELRPYRLVGFKDAKDFENLVRTAFNR